MSDPTPPMYEDIIAALHKVFKTIPGLKAVLSYEPRTFQTAPLLYTLLDRFDRADAGQIITVRYRILHRLVIQWQDNEQAEIQAMSFVNKIPAAIDKDRTLARVVSPGQARISDGIAGFLTNSNTVYRVYDFYSDVLTKGAQKSGI